LNIGVISSNTYNLVLAYYGKGEYDKAKDAFNHVLHINPDNENAQEGLNEIYNERHN